jgi:hypothetical protein
MIIMCKCIVMMNVNPAVRCKLHHLGLDGNIILAALLASGMGPSGGLSLMDVWECAGDRKVMVNQELHERRACFTWVLRSKGTSMVTMLSIDGRIGIKQDPAQLCGDCAVPYGAGGSPPFRNHISIGLVVSALCGLTRCMQDHKGVMNLANARNSY